MRWRYLILGILLAIPTATAIQLWPQRPAYCIPHDSRHYLSDDAANRDLLFTRFDTLTDEAPVLERWDADTGQIKSTTTLEWHGSDGNVEILNGNTAGHGFLISADRQTIYLRHLGWFKGTATRGTISAFFDANTGKLRSAFTGLDGPVFRELSPDGRWLAIIQLSGLTVCDTRTGKPLVEFPATVDLGPALTCFFSPDSRQMLVHFPKGKSSQEVMRLFDVESRQEKTSLAVPPNRTLCEWRVNEIRTAEHATSTSPHFLNDLGKRYRHKFDGRTLGSGEYDPLLDCNYYWLVSQSPLIDTDTWVAQFDQIDNRFAEKPPWEKVIEWVESNLDLELHVLKRYSSNVRLIDRHSKRVLFERNVRECLYCTFCPRRPPSDRRQSSLTRYRNLPHRRLATLDLDDTRSVGRYVAVCLARPTPAHRDPTHTPLTRTSPSHQLRLMY